VTQIPALIISLASGMLVAKGGTRGSTEKAVLGPAQLLSARFVPGGALDVHSRRRARIALRALSLCSGGVMGLHRLPAIPKQQEKDRAAAAAEVAAGELSRAERGQGIGQGAAQGL